MVFSCAGLPAGTSCTVTPPSVTLDGTSASNAQVVVTTTKGSALLIWPQPRIKERTIPWAVDRLDRDLSQLARQVAIFLAGCRNPSRSTRFFVWRRQLVGRTRTASAWSDPAGTSALVVKGASGNVSHAAAAQLTVN